MQVSGRKWMLRSSGQRTIRTPTLRNCSITYTSGASPMEMTYLEAIRQGIREEMQRDSDVFLLGEDIGVYGGAFKVTAGMLDEFGARRVMDTPVCESAIVGTAIGAAMMGLRPVIEMQFADFISCAYDQLI